ncbi:alpha-ketoglutarate-dependent dioxygenase alkB homolog 4 [Hetaerina americana]|uniref:alpha-ketoglutarate-dependent dioxygenase alkB homolog 4 n=1 Tax=Hetaerina americana TaxID=62018 RepID=UPI003A7F1CBD
MGHPRPCGCKGVRTCLVCETEFGAVKREFSINEECLSYVYCALCKKAWKGKNTNMWDEHPNHRGEPLDFPGIYIELDFITPEEQESLICHMDKLPWDPSQSGRRKQNYGPKCNFKKKRMKVGDFDGFPKFSEFIQQRFHDVSILEGFMTVEQCSLEYISDRGASIDPHIDDCWVWGERVVTVNVVGDSMLTLNRYVGTHERYNLADVPTYPRVVDSDGAVVWNPSCSDLDNGLEAELKQMDLKKPNAAEHAQEKACVATDDHLVDTLSSSDSPARDLPKGQNQNSNRAQTQGNHCQDVSKKTGNTCDSYSFSEVSDDLDNFPIIRVPMPARSLLVIYGAARYEWEHSVLREDITGRRVCLAYREFTPPFLGGGAEEKIGSEVLQKAANFW